MKETTPSAMPPCFERWCARFDDVLRNPSQKKGFRHYLGGLLGESERKNLTQMSNNAVGVVYHQLHHFLTEATWDAEKVNERRLQIMQQCSQTKVRKGFTLIIDDSGHRKSGNSFIIWQQLTGGLRRRWANKPLNTFTDVLSAFRTAISYRFVAWLQENHDVFALHLANLGLVWA